MTTACLPLLCLPIMQVAADPSDASVPQQEVAARIYRALDEKTEIEFIDTPLMEALSEIGQQHHINVMCDLSGSHAAGVDRSAPVNLILNGVKLRSALKILFDDLGLDYTIHDEVMVVSSAVNAKQSTSLHSYDISALLNDGDIEALVSAVREQIPETPDQTARISGYRNVLLVTGNRQVQESVQRTLKVLAKGLRDKAAPVGTFVSPLPNYNQR